MSPHSEIEAALLEHSDSNEINTYQIYVPTRGRADLKEFTVSSLEESGLNYYLVVEPQEYEIYSKNHDTKKILCMEENNQGVAYVRNFCKEHSSKSGHSHHWQIDDNIKNFAKRVGTKNAPCSARDCIVPVEKVVSQYENIGLAGLSHSLFAFSKANSIDINKQIYSCFLVKNDVKCNWRPKTVEDTDYSLQVLSAGFSTVMFNRLLINKATTMTIKGGNTDTEYADQGRMIRSLQLQKDWPQANFKIGFKHNRVKVFPSTVWRTFTQMPVKKGETTMTVENFLE